ncbi:MAG TPA: 30S ribosome-binding factor RbfA [Verrucomicrobiae bacterium]|nr:30S ribosome-binding factor RbfA [Verrucomicrobiae bacterium]
MSQVVFPNSLSAYVITIMNNRRIQRVSELVKQQIGEVLQELNLTGCGFVTVTSAAISPDLKDGRVYVSVIGNAEQKQRALDTLQAEHARIQHEVSRRIVLKYTPRLKFMLDETESEARRIESLLDDLDHEPPHD